MNLETGAFIFKVLIALVLIAGILKVLLKPVLRKRRMRRINRKMLEIYREENDGN